MNFLKPSYYINISCLVLASALLFLGLYYNIAETIELRTWDLRQKLFIPSAIKHKIEIIAIDQNSLDYMAKEQGYSWPWPRAVYGVLLKFLEKQGAKVVGFDLLFTEQSANGMSDDQMFAEEHPPNLAVVHAIATAKKNGVIDASFLPTITTPYPIEDLPQSPLRLAPVELLRNKARYFGNVSINPDPDGIYRRLDLFSSDGKTIFPAFPTALYLAGENHPALPLHNNNLVKFKGKLGSFPMASAAQVIEAALASESGTIAPIDPTRYRDAYILIGPWAPGLYDLRPTPVADKYYGVEFNAAVLENLLSQRFIATYSLWQNLFFALGALALLQASSHYAKKPASMILIFASVAIGYSLLAIILAYYDIWIKLTIPMSCLLLQGIATLGLRYQKEGKDKLFLRKAFAHYLAPEIVQQLIEDPQRLELGGEKKELTIFFSDIAGFTSISEQLEASHVGTLLSNYLQSMTEIILEHKGTLDKYIGDAIVAFWNAPVSLTDHAELGVNSAIACQQKLAQLQKKYLEEYGVDLTMRIGIHTGIVNVGNFGSLTRFNYTMVGDSANLASRLEGVCKVFGVGLLLSQATVEKISTECRLVGEVIVVGKKQSVRIYQPLCLTKLDRAQNLTYQKAIEFWFNSDFAAADQLFLELKQYDPVSAAYCARFDKQSVTEGVWRLDSK